MRSPPCHARVRASAVRSAGSRGAGGASAPLAELKRSPRGAALGTAREAKGVRLAASSPLENYLFRVLGRDHKLSIGGGGAGAINPMWKARSASMAGLHLAPECLIHAGPPLQSLLLAEAFVAPEHHRSGGCLPRRSDLSRTLCVGPTKCSRRASPRAARLGI